jgi:hypothetical protein
MAIFTANFEGTTVNSGWDSYTEIRTLNTAKDIASGKASQNSVNFAYILAAMGILISMIDLVLRLIGH